MTLFTFTSILYALFAISTFRTLDARNFYEPNENLGSLIARVFLAATWPFIWTVRIINKLTSWVLYND